MRRENRLRTRADFDRTTRSGGRVSSPELVLLHGPRPDGAPTRVGFAVGRSIGTAVVRNRVRRRMREAIRPLLPRLGPIDLVVVARPPCVAASVTDLGRVFEETARRGGLISQFPAQ